MAEHIDTIKVCSDCYMLINLDYVSFLEYLDYYNGEDEGERIAKELEEKINDTLENYSKYNPEYLDFQLVSGDSENDDEFNSRPCELCGSHLAGSRYEVSILATIRN